jgi:mono/diheme cytochrome c family protein
MKIQGALLRIPVYPYVISVLAAMLVSAFYWQFKSHGPAWKWLTGNSALYADAHGRNLAWKEPLLPAQFTQATCGACHRGDDLVQAPRLIHGRKLLVKFNCIACHALQDIERPEMLGPDLTNIGTKVTRDWIYKWLKDPRTLTDENGRVLVDGVATDPRMPKFDLSELELRALSAYLSVQGAPKASSLSPGSIQRNAINTDALEEGKTRFNQMFCVTCHAIAVDRGGEIKVIGGDIGPELTKVGSKVRPAWLVKWLRDPQGYLQHTRMPRYEWSERNLSLVAGYLLNGLTDPDLLKDVPKFGPVMDDEVKLGSRLFVDKGCAECHVIQGVTPRPNYGPDLSAEGMAGGQLFVDINAPHDKSFEWHFVQTSIERLRIIEAPVPHSLISFIQNKITNPPAVTPATNMPSFHMSQSNLDDMTTALLSMVGPRVQDRGNSPIVEKPRTDFQPPGEAGRLYQRYRCYVCHAFKGYGGDLAPNLSYEGSRSRRDWLIAFLRNPQTLRPTLTVRMPEFNMSAKDATTLADYISRELRSPEIDPSSVDDREFTPEMAQRGKNFFEKKYQCQSCHTIGSAGGYVGPSLNNIGNWMTPAWVEGWLRNPQDLVSGAIDPRRTFTDAEIGDMTAYLLSLKHAPARDEAAQERIGGGQK